MSNKFNNYKQINGKIEKKTGKMWADSLGLQVVKFNDAFTAESFVDKNIDLETFMNLASQCEIICPFENNRRGASLLKRKLNKKLDY